MSTLETRMAGRRKASQATDRRKKLILIGLTVLLATLLAIQGPKLLKHSGSSANVASAPAATPSSTAAATGTRSLTVLATKTTARRLRAIHGMSAKDLFVPLVQDSSSTPSSTSSSASPSAPATTSAPAAAASPAATTPAVTRPVHVKPAAPNAAVIWTNGRRQVVGLSQVFTVGDTQFRLVGVTRDTVRIAVLGGAFAGRGQAISVHKGHRVQLANTATGVRYGLLFSQAGVAANSK